MMTTIARTVGKAASVAAVTAILSAVGATPVRAQDDPNPGALSFAAGLDSPSVYLFRGIQMRQVRIGGDVCTR